MGPLNQLVNAASQYQVGRRRDHQDRRGRAPPGRAGRDRPDRSPTAGSGPALRWSSPRCDSGIAPSFPIVAARRQLRHPARRHDGFRWPVRRGQDHGVLPDRAVLRRQTLARSGWTAATPRVAARRAARGHRLRRAGRAGAVRHAAREPDIRRARDGPRRSWPPSLRITRLTDLIDRLPDGLETLVGPPRACGSPAASASGWRSPAPC